MTTQINFTEIRLTLYQISTHWSQDIRGRGDSPPWNSYSDPHTELRMMDEDMGNCSCHHWTTYRIQRDILFRYTQRLMLN